MCTICGCSANESRIENHNGSMSLRPFNASHVASIKQRFHSVKLNADKHNIKVPPLNSDEYNLHFGLGLAHAHTPGLSQERMVHIEQDILAKNNRYAAENRQYLADKHILALNLLSSPGSGKTTLLTETIVALRSRIPITVIEGDQQTTQDADRIRATGAAAIQINTGKGCHLDASMIRTALTRLLPLERSILMIENVGNLVCPAGFDLGEAHKVVVLSVTEGEDKPLKYPDMFRAAQLMILNKIDLLPYLHFDVERCIIYARRINPELQVLQVSATTGQGVNSWLAWIEQTFQSHVSVQDNT